MILRLAGVEPARCPEASSSFAYMRKKVLLLLVVVAVWAIHAEKLTVYPPARTAEEKIALAERTLEYVAKSVPADRLKPLADELAIDKEWYAKAATPGEKYAAERAIMSVRRRSLFLHPDLQFANRLAVQRGLPFSDKPSSSTKYGVPVASSKFKSKTRTRCGSWRRASTLPSARNLCFRTSTCPPSRVKAFSA